MNLWVVKNSNAKLSLFLVDAFSLGNKISRVNEYFKKILSTDNIGSIK